MADESASVEYVVADMLSQAEHGRDSQAMVVCNSEAMAEEIAGEVLRQANKLERADYVRYSLYNSRVIALDSRDDMIDFANEYAADGLRLVEVKKNQLYQIPDLMDSLAANPLKFILFIDDLSFTANDDNFAALKAILEGSVGGRAGNIAVYATSNRRHLIKETLSDRSGDDIHESDTRQELMSLSARFGLTITFLSPDRERYLHIVGELAKQYGLDTDQRELAVRSEAFAIRMGGRSARVAKQFIELCKAGVPY